MEPQIYAIQYNTRFTECHGAIASEVLRSVWHSSLSWHFGWCHLLQYDQLLASAIVAVNFRSPTARLVCIHVSRSDIEVSFAADIDELSYRIGLRHQTSVVQSAADETNYYGILAAKFSIRYS